MASRPHFAPARRCALETLKLSAAPFPLQESRRPASPPASHLFLIDALSVLGPAGGNVVPTGVTGVKEKK